MAPLKQSKLTLEQIEAARKGRIHNLPVIRIHAAREAAMEVAKLIKETELTAAEKHIVDAAVERVIDIFETGARRVSTCPHEDAIIGRDGEVIGECPTHGKVANSIFGGLLVGPHLAVIFDPLEA